MSLDLIPGADIIASGLNAERARMEIVANNLANASSTGTESSVYRRRTPVFEAVVKDSFSNNPTADLGGVKISSIEEDKSAPQMVYSPFNPNANSEGMVATTNISPIMEMMDLVTSTRAYEANLNALKQTYDMANKTVTLGKQS